MLLANALRAAEPAQAKMEILRDLVDRLRIPQVQLKIYHQCLSANERTDYDEDCVRRKRPASLDLWVAWCRGISHPLAIVHLAFKTNLLPIADRDWLLREMGEEFPIDWEIQHAVSLGGLVVVEDPRTIFWDGLKIKVDWKRNKKAWEVLYQLAARARQYADLMEKDVYPDDVVSDATLATAVSRLKRMLPSTLSESIGPGIQPRTQRLKLERDRIRLFRSKSHRQKVSGEFTCTAIGAASGVGHGI